MLTVFIKEAMRESGIEYNELSAVAVSRGPGSYTGLRIGVSAAKGICYASDLPLISVDTLKIMAQRVIKITGSAGSDEPPPDGAKLNEAGTEELLLCPMIDARRMEVYMALFDTRGNQVSKISAEIIDENTFSRYKPVKKILFFGDGAEKCKKVLVESNAAFIPGIYPSAREMADLSYNSLQEERFEDTAYFEPFYLKDFIATKPKNR